MKQIGLTNVLSEWNSFICRGLTVITNNFFYLYASQTKVAHGLNVAPELAVVSSALEKQMRAHCGGALTWVSEDGAHSCLCLAVDFGQILLPAWPSAS